MTSMMINTKVEGAPEFLKTKFDDHHKDIAEKAVALYIKDHNLTRKNSPPKISKSSGSFNTCNSWTASGFLCHPNK